MQTLSKRNDTILLEFTKIQNLTSNINRLLRIRINYLNELKKREKEEFQKTIDNKKFVEQKPFHDVLEHEIIDSIKNEYELPPFPPNNSFLSFLQFAEEIEKERKIEKKEYIQTQ